MEFKARHVHPKARFGRHHPPNQEFNMDYPTYADLTAEMARVRAMGLVCEVCDDATAEVECEDITGYSRRPCDYLCSRCYEKRCDGPDEPDYDAPDADELRWRQEQAMKLKR
jgi:hypothetical protein